jgi:hypothetical protein
MLAFLVAWCSLVAANQPTQADCLKEQHRETMLWVNYWLGRGCARVIVDDPVNSVVRCVGVEP